MNAFLQKQNVRNDNGRRKFVRKTFMRVQQISLVLFVWSLGLGFVYGFYHLLFEKGVFIVKNIEVDGKLMNLSSAEIEAAGDPYIGKNLFTVDLKKLQKQISANPWAREVAVTRKLPCTIWIYVNEYNPFALLVSDDLYLVDADGTVFKKAGGTENKDLPAITGILQENDIQTAISLINGYSISPIADYFSLAEVNFDEARGYSVTLPGMVVRLGFDVDTISEKLQKFHGMMGAITVNKGKIRYIDLNMPGKVVVKYES